MTLLKLIYGNDSSPVCVLIATDKDIVALSTTPQETDSWNEVIKGRKNLLTFLQDPSPVSAQEWLTLLSFNMGQHTFSDIIPVPEGKNARAAAKDLLDQNQEVPDDHIPTLALAKQAWDEVKDVYPTWPETPDPEADLEYRKLAAGSVDPESLHLFVPDWVGAPNCTWCDRIQNHPLHNG